ncbi:NAD(P)H-dependent oxidoreductase subunit E [Halanaerobium salsuginis]|uniref:Thioredoxin-like [2Fe-2S] ferredoxin n=1 Tax=Halanaerobium salsuginis TaxID=29563 RepID=A0A1I4HA74_9FIRM|nr:NAD(P)H-dependent oxidoreductase subunit E [Halanaerobium salsuginis]SFL38680.1 Thioredoxin-like [2Fe-2S] ferredoxin [Halanaerobium salsuginis]
MAKNKLEICIGTPCYLMGAADLMDTFNSLETELKSAIDFKTCHCLAEECEQAPVISFNDKIYHDINPEKLYKIIRENIR